MRVLEFGPGDGRLMRRGRELGVEVVGIDVQTWWRDPRPYHDERRMLSADGFDMVLLQDGKLSLPYEAGEFDFGVAVSAITKDDTEQVPDTKTLDSVLVRRVSKRLKRLGNVCSGLFFVAPAAHLSFCERVLRERPVAGLTVLQYESLEQCIQVAESRRGAAEL